MLLRFNFFTPSRVGGCPLGERAPPHPKGCCPRKGDLGPLVGVFLLKRDPQQASAPIAANADATRKGAGAARAEAATTTTTAFANGSGNGGGAAEAEASSSASAPALLNVPAKSTSTPTGYCE